MGLRINTNVLALSAQNRLQSTTKKLSGSLERLSSGLRINKGSDDVVGLLKSESLRSQIRGITAVETNLSNAQSLLGIAEGTLAQLTDIAQQVREKVVQAADDSISSADRTNLTTAISDLTEEFNRLTTASEFDGVKLLNGSFTAKTFQVGPNKVDTLSLSISDARTTAIGKVAVVTAQTATAVNTSGGTVTLTSPSGLTINSVSIGASAFSSDGVSNAASSDSALAYVNAINSYEGQTGVTAVINQNSVEMTYTNGDALTASDTLSINGVALSSVAYASNDTGVASLVDAINAIATQTGVSAEITAGSDKLTLTATDGRNIDVSVAGSTTATRSFYSASDQIYKASGATTTTVHRGGFKLVSESTFSLSGHSDELGVSATSGQLISSTTLSNLDVSTSTNASEGIFILDNVISQLQSRRSDVGSKSIRMEVASNELKTRKENLTSAESVIRDADVATETAALTASQILQQAGVSVLARANSVPQIALTLLQ